MESRQLRGWPPKDASVRPRETLCSVRRTPLIDGRIWRRFLNPLSFKVAAICSRNSATFFADFRAYLCGFFDLAPNCFSRSRAMWKVPGILLSSGLLRPCFWRYHRALRRNGILELLGHLDGTLNPSAGAAPGGTVNITVQYVDKAVMMAGPAAMATCETRWPGAGLSGGWRADRLSMRNVSSPPTW